MSDLNAPIDDLNAACAQARTEIRRRFYNARAIATRRVDLLAEEMNDRLPCLECVARIKHVHHPKEA